MYFTAPREDYFVIVIFFVIFVIVHVLLQQHVVNIAKSLRLDLSTSCSAKDVHEVKAAVWALGHIGSTVGGLDLLLKEGVVSDLVIMAESCPVLSIRG